MTNTFTSGQAVRFRDEVGTEREGIIVGIDSLDNRPEASLLQIGSISNKPKDFVARVVSDFLISDAE